MSKNVAIKLSYSGIGAMLRGDEMKQMVTDYANGVVLRAGEGFEMSVHNTGQRQAASIYPVTREAYLDNLRNNTLMKVAK